MKERRILCQLPFLILISLPCLFLLHLVLLPIAPPPDVADFVIHTELRNYTHPMQLLGINDYGLLVNYTFSFDQLHLSCNESTFLLVMVHSSPINFQKRATIRSTWGKKTEWMTILFALGRSENETVRQQLKEENQLYGDILQGSFLDVYRNLTYKHIMCLKYCIYHCPQAKYILKVDDDSFVNIMLLRNFLNTDLSPYGVSNALLCPVQRRALPLRSYRSKWRVSFEEYPLRKYPPYCLGWAIIYSPDVAFSLYKLIQASAGASVFWIDDIFITGTMAIKSNIFHTDISDLIITPDDQKHLENNNVYPLKPFLLGRPDLTVKQIRILWERVKSRVVPKSARRDSPSIR